MMGVDVVDGLSVGIRCGGVDMCVWEVWRGMIVGLIVGGLG